MRLRVSKGTSTAFVAAFLAAVVTISGAATVVLYDRFTGTGTSSSSSSMTSTLTEPAYVTVFGLVSTLGEGVHPTSMVFSSASRSYVAPVADGSFSIALHNHESYVVSLKWTGSYTWQAGQIDMGPLTVNMSAGSMGSQSYNVAQMTPSSIVRVQGSVFWQIQSSIPAAIRFTASDGETFQAPVSNMTFAIDLPNMMNYEVYVQSSSSTGPNDWYYFHQLQVDAAVGVIGLTVRVGY